MAQFKFFQPNLSVQPISRVTPIDFFLFDLVKPDYLASSLVQDHYCLNNFLPTPMTVRN